MYHPDRPPKIPDLAQEAKNKELLSKISKTEEWFDKYGATKHFKESLNLALQMVPYEKRKAVYLTVLVLAKELSLDCGLEP